MIPFKKLEEDEQQDFSIKKSKTKKPHKLRKHKTESPPKIIEVSIVGSGKFMQMKTQKEKIL